MSATHHIRPDVDDADAVEAVFFDIDGTLVDSRATIMTCYADALRTLLGNPGLDPWIRVDPEELLPLRAGEAFAMLAASHPPADADELAVVFQSFYSMREPGWFDGAVEVLRALSERGTSLGVVSGKARQRVESHLAAAGVSCLFSIVITGDDVAAPKPDPEPVLAALERSGSTARWSVLVGDGEADILAARAAGVRSVGVAYGFHPAACRAAGPDFWIDSVVDLLEVLPTRR